MDDPFEFIKSVLFGVFVVFWTFGGVAGMIYWAIKEDLLNVVLSLVIPGYGGVSLIVDLVL